MQRMVCLVFLMVLGLALTLEAAPTLTQENFDLEKFMGRWYEVAVVSNCPYYMHRKQGNPDIVALELKHVTFEDNFTLTAAASRNGSCQVTSTVYGLTDTPGRFFHHVARLRADVDSFVVHTKYDEYAMILQLSTDKPSGNTTTIVKLYSLTDSSLQSCVKMEVTPYSPDLETLCAEVQELKSHLPGRTTSVFHPLLDSFKTLVRKHGANDDTIIMNQHKGECLAGEPTSKPAAQPQTFVPKRSKRNTPVIPAEEELSDI